MGARRVIALAVLVTALGTLPASSFADTYPPQVDATEVVTGDATPPATDDATPPTTDVLGEQIVAPGTAGTVDPALDAEVAPAVDALSSTGAGVLVLVLVALVLLVVGGGLATLSERRRTRSGA